ncbi:MULTISPECIES: YggN family protein [unclassified Pseudoalteromonas]|uniref:YggN family protein n=1 Tax=unclassified Pseudoalteromonas TaxID=194690 RepID=UPI002097C3E5|nr:YggN family protein [Pseudoalteromonas sp. XMcav2-N]MCO7190954.1 YggN family protein [Pseudoalteromonas sp. XMcav2-N]
MKTILLASTLALSTQVAAHTDNHFSVSTDECAVDFKNDVQITPDQVFIKNGNGQPVMIDAQGFLFIADQPVSLNQDERMAMQTYADTLRAELPKVASIALQGVALAGVAIEEVATAFNLHNFDSLSGLMDELHTEIEGAFYQQGTFVMGEQAFNEFGEQFEHQFEEKIEQAIEGAMMESIGSLLVAIGSEMVSSGGDMDRFEQRMENLGAEIEQKIEHQAKALEQQANALCGNFKTIAEQESQLSAMIPQMKGYQLFAYR